MKRRHIFFAFVAFTLIGAAPAFAAEDAAPSVSVYPSAEETSSAVSVYPADDPAPSVSVFFTPDETRQIEALNKNSAAAMQRDIHLGAVMYYGPNNWMLWLQGERWTPETQRADLHILDVAPDAVRLSVAVSPDAVPREVTLRPNQTYRPSTDDVVEGDDP